MENIVIEGQRGAFYIPSVNFDAEKGICEISGESYLENTDEFYLPLLDWIDNYFKKVKKDLTFNIKLTYFNTSSSKYIVEILSLLKKYQDKGFNITVNWYYDDKSDDVEEDIEEVEDFMLETGIKINLIPYSAEN